MKRGFPVPDGAAPLRGGVSRVEVLVLLAIGGTLAAILVHQIGAAREAARKTQCRNTLHNLGLALHNYHDSFGSFPPGWYPPHPQDPTGAGSWGWGVLLMPYLD
jgi:hypothetical protein